MSRRISRNLTERKRQRRSSIKTGTTTHSSNKCTRNDWTRLLRHQFTSSTRRLLSLSSSKRWTERGSTSRKWIFWRWKSRGQAMCASRTSVKSKCEIWICRPESRQGELTSRGESWWPSSRASRESPVLHSWRSKKLRCSTGSKIRRTYSWRSLTNLSKRCISSSFLSIEGWKIHRRL